MKFKKINYNNLPLLLVLLLMFSCDVSSISDKDLKDVSHIKAIIHITDGPNTDFLTNLKVYISDGEKQIIKPQIKILVNDKPLQLFVREELYYTKISYYTTDKFTRSESYYFEIILPDSMRYPLAYIKPSNISDSIEVNTPKTIDRSRNFTLKWQKICLPAKLEIWKGIKQKKSKNYSGGRYAETTIIKNLDSQTGEYVVPKSFFEDSLTITNYLKLILNHREFGLTNPQLLKNSNIIYNFKIKRTIDVP